MTYGPTTAEITHDCKLKAVNPPFRSVSTPRGRKDLRVVGRVNPPARTRSPRRRPDLSKWNVRRLAKKLEDELSRDALRRPSALATKRESTVAQPLEQALSEGQ
jgi:hypothetical protein